MEELIAKHNPWWKAEEDVAIRKWEAMKMRWVPKWIDEVSVRPFSLNFVIGSRQTGKSTGIKLLIQRLLKAHHGVPESIFYFNCDFLPDVDSFKKLIDAYIEFKKSRGIRSSRIFLDEVTSVPDWWRVIKGYIDLGIFENDVLTITGSSSLKLRGDAELFPGRRGGGKNIIVHPLSFREFLEINGTKIEPARDVKKDMAGLLTKKDDILRLFPAYVKTGGFPLSVNNDPTAEEQLIAGFEGEVLRAKKSLQLMKSVVASIVRKSPSALSFSTIGKDIGTSYKTVQEYAEVLKGLFMMDTALYSDGQRIMWRKERKFFFLDPFISRTLAWWSGETYLESAFHEWLAQSHLVRRFGSVSYFRNGFEIDCLAGEIKVEIKVGKPHVRYPNDVLILDSESLPMFLSVIV